MIRWLASSAALEDDLANGKSCSFKLYYTIPNLIPVRLASSFVTYMRDDTLASIKCENLKSGDYIDVDDRSKSSWLT